MAKFPTIAEYGSGPSEEELDALVFGRTSVEEFEFNDPSAEIDNRTAVRMFLRIRNVPPQTFDALIEPYDLGFDKKSDGKSTPIFFMRIPRFLKVLGLKRDIVSVRHDLEYYRGIPAQRSADNNYLDRQREIGERKWIATMEWFALRIVGRFSWNSHKNKRRTVPDYGTDEFIPNLPDVSF